MPDLPVTDLTDAEIAAELARLVPMAEKCNIRRHYMIDGLRLLEMAWQIRRLQGLPVPVADCRESRA
jgi:hypothetical protein